MFPAITSCYPPKVHHKNKIAKTSRRRRSHDVRKATARGVDDPRESHSRNTTKLTRSWGHDRHDSRKRRVEDDDGGTTTTTTTTWRVDRTAMYREPYSGTLRLGEIRFGHRRPSKLRIEECIRPGRPCCRRGVHAKGEREYHVVYGVVGAVCEGSGIAIYGGDVVKGEEVSGNVVGEEGRKVAKPRLRLG